MTSSNYVLLSKYLGSIACEGKNNPEFLYQHFLRVRAIFYSHLVFDAF